MPNGMPFKEGEGRVVAEALTGKGFGAKQVQEGLSTGRCRSSLFGRVYFQNEKRE
jgi:hypothetical protein